MLGFSFLLSCKCNRVQFPIAACSSYPHPEHRSSHGISRQMQTFYVLRLLLSVESWKKHPVLSVWRCVQWIKLGRDITFTITCGRACVTCGRACVACGRTCVTCGRACVTCGRACVTCGRACVTNKYGSKVKDNYFTRRTLNIFGSFTHVDWQFFCRYFGTTYRHRLQNIWSRLRFYTV